MAGSARDERDRLARQSEVYLAIISRYKDYIEEKESVSVSELPTLVTPKDDAVLKKVAEIQAGFGSYAYEKDFHSAAEKAYSFVKGEIDSAVLPLEFWLSPRDTLGCMMGDTIDKNILLCSMLIALGNPSAKVLINMKDEKVSSVVYFEFGPDIHMFDVESGQREFRSKDEMLAALGVREDSSAYEFNNQRYLDLP